MNKVALVKSNNSYLGRIILFEIPTVDDHIEFRNETYQVICRIWRTFATKEPELRLVVSLLQDAENENK